MILAGDIGGTKTVLALYRSERDRLEVVREAVFPSREAGRFEDLLGQFVFGAVASGELTAACFGVAGPVRDGQCRTTNLPWFLDERQLAKDLAVPKVKLLNDLEAAAFGMLFLEKPDMAVLHEGAPTRPCGHIAVLAAGTGLGEAVLHWDGKEYAPIASEGGHADFAPQTDREIELLRFLRAEFGHVSYERVLSGPGLFNIYRFLRETSGVPEPAWLRERVDAGNPGAVIGDVGLARGHALCVEALDLFASIYGAEAGNLALKVLARGGVYLGGGIAPKLLDKLADGTFTRSYLAKGRYTELLRSIPVTVVLNTKAPLLGAAHYALRI
ncbi:MAG: glucokinase [Nitrospirota bacterium]